MTPERIEQIERLRSQNTGPSFGYVHELCTAIDDLLSLVKSQEAGDGGDVRVLNQIRERAADGYERASGGSEVKAGNLMLNDLHYVLSSHDGQYARGATSMRSRCVEKVRAYFSCFPCTCPKWEKDYHFAVCPITIRAELVAVLEKEDGYQGAHK